MASTKFYLDLRGKAKDGKGSVLIILYHNATTTSIGTGVRILPYCWSKKSQRCVKTPDAEILNASLLNQKQKIDKAIALLSMEEEFQSLSASELKRRIAEGKAERHKGHTLVSLFDEYVTGDLKAGTIDIYRIAKKKVISFCGEEFLIEDISLKWLRQFDAFLSRTQGINGRSIYLRALRRILNYAAQNGIRFSYPFSSFQIKSETTRKLSVPVELLRKFLTYPVSKKNERYRDYFFLMFYLIGINIKDLLLAEKDQVVDGRLEYTREKTRKKYSVKIEPEAEALLRKYEGKGKYLLEAMDHCQHYKSFAHMTNDALKSIDLIPDIRTNYARHCWATFAYEIEIPLDIISQAMGHSLPNRTTLIYVRQDRTKVDAANRKVIDYLLGN